MKKRANQLLVALFALAIFGTAIVRLVSAPQDYSLTERRGLAQMPKITAKSVDSGKFMSDFETYTLDQFPMRDTLRRIKALSSRYLFHRSDNNGYYTVDDYLSRLEYPENTAQLGRNANKLSQIYHQLMEDTGCRVYLSIIPDKNFFMAPLRGYPAMDYDKIVADYQEKLDFATYLDIAPLLELGDFYRTDQHWRQERITDVAETLAHGMGAETAESWQEIDTKLPFYGAYQGQSALKLPADDLHYLTSPTIEGCTVTSYSTGRGKESSVYDMKKAVGKDPYELFLSGAEPLLVIENPAAETDKELVVFRDSFGSSLVPLLVPGYARITVVDLRYMQSGLLGNFVSFDGQDVLFLYSTLVLNHTISM